MKGWRKKHNSIVEHGVHSTRLTQCQSIWIHDRGTFCKIVKHFLAHSKPSKERPVIQLLDNHDLYLYIQAIVKYKESGVAVFIFPPPCSHELQPRNRSVKGTLKTYMNLPYNACTTRHQVQQWQYVTSLVPSTHLYISLLFLQIPKHVSRFWNLLFQLEYFWKRRHCGSLGYR